MAVNAKARVAQLTGSRSITAAAELSGNLMGISSIGGERAFVAGGAQVRLRASAGG